MQSLSTRARLALLGLAAVLGILITAVLGMVSMSGMANRIQDDLQRAQQLSQVMVEVKSAQSTFLNQIQEWKNILIRGNDAEQFEKYSKAFRERGDKVQRHLEAAQQALKQLGAGAEGVTALQDAHRGLMGKYAEALSHYEISDPHAGKTVDKLVKGMDRATVEAMNTLVSEMEQRLNQEIAQRIDEGEANNSRVQAVFLALSALGLAVVIGLSVTIYRSLMHALGGEPAYAAQVARAIAQGDLSMKLAVQAGDRDSLLASMQQMQQGLHDLVANVDQIAQTLIGAAQQMSVSAQQVEQGSEAQSEASASSAAAIEEMSTSIQLVASNAQHAQSVAENSRTRTAESGQLVQDTIRDIHLIAGSVQNSTTRVYGLGEQSDRISGIANVIKEIADQTNLLALNAAIEAARAGEQGRGFAVVADEVRKLAEKTTASTQEISAMILAIQEGTKAAVQEMEKGSQQVAEGVETASHAGRSMGEIEHGTTQVLQAVDEISVALREQSAASQQIAHNIERIALMTDENCAAVGEVSHAAEQLHRLANELKQRLGRFRL